jgi:hypothetical protein
MPTLERLHTTPPLVDAAGFAWPSAVASTEPCPACDTGEDRCVVCNSTGHLRLNAWSDAR